jgi:quinol monooxygenase YgiN
MVIEYIRYKIDSSRQESFIEAYQNASGFLRESEFCMGYELTQCEEVKENFILRIDWTSTQDHLNGFRKSPEFGQFLNLIRPYFNDIQEMNHYEQTKVVNRKV